MEKRSVVAGSLAGLVLAGATATTISLASAQEEPPDGTCTEQRIDGALREPVDGGAMVHDIRACVYDSEFSEAPEPTGEPSPGPPPPTTGGEPPPPTGSSAPPPPL